MPLAPYPPVQIDIPQAALQPNAEPESGAGGQVQGPWLFGGNLYFLGVKTFPTDAMGMWVSNDFGATWTELDNAGAPASPGVGVFDGNHTVVCCLIIPDFPGGSIALQNFDLATGLWGVQYALTVPPTLFVPQAVFVRSNGDVVVPGAANSTQVPAFSGAAAMVWNGAVWTGLIDLGANAIPLQVPAWALTPYIAIPQSYLMDNDILHMGYSVQDTFTLVTGFFYQQLLADNSLGSFFAFPNSDTRAPFTPAFDPFRPGIPVIYGGKIVWPVRALIGAGAGPPNGYLEIASVYVGTPVAAPVWTLSPVPTGIDPDSLTDPNLQNGDSEGFSTVAIVGAGRLLVVYLTADVTGAIDRRFRLCQTTDVDPTLGWTAETLIDLSTEPPDPNFNIPLQIIFSPGPVIDGVNLGMTATAIDPTGLGSLQRVTFWMGAIALGPVPPAGIVGPKITLRGVKRFRRVSLPSPCVELPEIPHVERAV